jgi:myosin heavy subunit
MNKLEVRQEIATLSREQIMAIGQLTADLSAAGHDELSDTIVNTLDKYEEEIIRLQTVNSRVRTKNRNYRRTLKQLQRAHEASLHRENTLKQTVEEYRQLLIEALAKGPSCQVFEPGELDEPMLYSPVRFNNEPVANDAQYAR